MFEQKVQLVKDIALALRKNGAVMSVSILAEVLNQNGLHRNDGYPYEGGRGSFKFVSLCYDYFKELGDQNSAEAIASSYVNSAGGLAHEDK